MRSPRLILLRQLQNQVVARDGISCRYCGIETLVRKSPAWKAARYPHGRERTVDHLLPVSQGGKDELGNLCISCRSCNARKGTATRFGMNRGM